MYFSVFDNQICCVKRQFINRKSLETCKFRPKSLWKVMKTRVLSCRSVVLVKSCPPSACTAKKTAFFGAECPWYSPVSLAHTPLSLVSSHLRFEIGFAGVHIKREKVLDQFEGASFEMPKNKSKKGKGEWGYGPETRPTWVLFATSLPLCPTHWTASGVPRKQYSVQCSAGECNRSILLFCSLFSILRVTYCDDDLIMFDVRDWCPIHTFIFSTRHWRSS